VTIEGRRAGSNHSLAEFERDYATERGRLDGE
jgi:hypothetical protein